MDTPEMTQVSVKVELLRDNRIPAGLLQVEARRRDEVARSEEVRQLGANVPVGLCEQLLKVAFCV
jgi:hypothetical protein